MWVVHARKSILGNLVTLVLLSILAGMLGGGLIGIAMQPKSHTTSDRSLFR
jgi:hypothetical protein